MSTFRKSIYALMLLFFVQGCIPAQTVTQEPPAAATFAPLPATSTPLPTPTLIPAQTEIPPTPQPEVILTVTKGNLYIRRGPGLPYNQIGVLREGESARIIGQDVLSRWVQVQMPNSQNAGWVSVMTDFTRVDGDLNSVPNFTFTDWFKPAFIKNCTEHDLVVEPGDHYLYNLYTNSLTLNEVQVDPGSYTVHDMFLPGAPEIQRVEVREGMTVYITVNGLGVSHNCP